MFTILFLSACAVYVLLDLQLLRGLRNLELRSKQAAAPQPPTSLSPAPFITVLIAARDEEDNIARVLNALLAQEYPRDKTQIVVANDRSVDRTESILRDYADRFPDIIEFVTIDTLPEGWAPKKHALMRGLERARGEWIAVTDADSEMSATWLSCLSREFGDKTGMVLGITAYAEDRVHGYLSKPTLAEGARALEFASLGITSAALLGLGFPVIANANNLAYRKRAFDEAGAFERHGRVVSGDDDFTLQEINATGNWEVRHSIAAGALMRTAAPESWRPFWEQRKRWGSKCFHYRAPQVAFLLAVFAFYLSIPVLLLAGFVNPALGWLGLTGFVLKTAADFVVMQRGLRVFGLSPLLRHFPLTALLHIPLILSAVTVGTLRGFTWKGQKLGRKVRG